MPYIKKGGITYGGFPNATVASKQATAIVPSSIKQLTRVGGTQEFAPVTIPEAVKFSEGGSLETTVNSIATIESSSTASKAYVVGDFLVSGGQLYKVIADIAIGETFVVDTNIESTSVGSELSELNAGLIKMDLLWTNPNPTASFSAQTISLALSDYDMVMVNAFADGPGADSFAFSFIGRSGLLYGQANTRHYRKFNVTSTGVQFEAGYSAEANAPVASQNNATQMPQNIYGIKLSN